MWEVSQMCLRQFHSQSQPRNYSIFLYFYLRLGSMLIQLDAIVSVNSESSTLNQFRNIQGFYGNYLHAAHHLMIM